MDADAGRDVHARIRAEELALVDRMVGVGQLYGLAITKAGAAEPESTDSAVDSELALWWDNRYIPGGWVPNLLLAGRRAVSRHAAGDDDLPHRRAVQGRRPADHQGLAGGREGRA